MFETSKLPTEQRTVTGNTVSFNTHYALPLDACKVSFMATESGTGEKSPSNPYTISGVSAIGLTANSTPVSVSFGDTRYGGELDVLTGVLTVTYNKTVYDGSSDEGWGEYSAYNGFRLNNYYMKIGTSQTGIANWLDIVNARTDFGLVLGANNNTIFASQITNNIAGITDLESWKTFLSTHNLEIVYPLAEPITIQLSANELSSIIGNNTFSTDTGTLEITFADLQEKSASGSVATFNTALAMPLASCSIAVNAWQEGSGDPSPDNVRPIHGFSEVNATRAGKNLFDEQYPNLGSMQYRWIYVGKGTFTMSSNQPIDTSNIVFFFGGKVSGGASSANYVKGNIYRTVTSDDGYVTVAYRKLNEYSPVNYHYQIEVGSTPTAYEPYVTPTIYTIQLGQEVYGAEVDVVNGVAHCTHGYMEYDGSETTWSYREESDSARININNMVSGRYLQGLCNYFPTVSSLLTFGACFGSGNYTLYINKIASLGCANVDEFKTWVSTHNIEVVYPLKSPFDIQLTPTQIETLIGNNTIFADTGDIDLTYKDCDLAKRGDFRQVFKIPD